MLPDLPAVLSPAFRGCVHIVRDGQPLLTRASGYADLANQIPNTPATRFASASAGKAFVAVGILRLIQSGRLSPEDTLGCLLDLDLGRIDPHVTVRQLLTHTSGVPDYFDESVMDDYEALWRDFPNYRVRKNADLLPLFTDKPMAEPPGARFRYNNSGYVLLALVLEAVTGRPFDDAIRDMVFDPCGMKAAGYFALDRLPSGCANHYIFCPDTGEYRTNIYSVDAKGTGAGGAFITVGDIEAFWRGLLGGRLLSPSMRARAFSRQAGSDKGGWYGYGFWLRPRPGHRDAVYFEGCDPGVSFLSEYDPDTRTLSVLASNYGDNVWREMRRIREILY